MDNITRATEWIIKSKRISTVDSYYHVMFVGFFFFKALPRYFKSQCVQSPLEI